MGNLKCLSAPKIWLFTALFSLLSCFAQGASALEYYWTSSADGGLHHSSASAACSSGVSALGGPGVKFVRFESDSFAWCEGNNYSGQAYGPAFWMSRYGDSCPANTTYNASAHTCDAPEPDKCESTAGQSVYNEVDGGEIGKSAPEPPGSVCNNQCQYAFSYEAPTTAYRFVEQKEGKNMNHAYFKYRYQGNGTSCTQTNPGSSGSVFDQPPTKPPTSTEPTKEFAESCTEWTTTGDGTASRSCTKSTVYKDPGKLNCDTSSGTVVCTPGNPSPALSDTKVTDTTTKTTNADGSTSTSTSTVTGITKCFGVKPCDTSSTTTTSTGGTNADGSDKGTSTTCTGDQCKNDDWDNATKDPDEEGEEEGEDDKSSVSGEACDASVACEGDAIQCAILRSQKASTCADADFRKVDADKIQQTKTGIESAFSGEDYQPLTADSENTHDLSNVLDTSSRFSSTCPVLPPVTYSWVDGTTQSLDLNVSGLCQFLTWFGYLNVAFAMRAAAEIIARGLS